MLVIGLTGPSGAGKSTVGEVFASFGLPVLDADRIYHDLLSPPSACLNELVSYFGAGILTSAGTLDRRALGSLVFHDKHQLEQLNRIAHQHILSEVHRRLRVMRADGVPAAVFDAPQLFESGAERECTVVVSVLADIETRVHRIMQRDGISRWDALERIMAQRTDAFFRSHSDYVIENNSTPDLLIPQVKQILTETGVIPH